MEIEEVKENAEDVKEDEFTEIFPGEGEQPIIEEPTSPTSENLSRQNVVAVKHSKGKSSKTPQQSKMNFQKSSPMLSSAATSGTIKSSASQLSHPLYVYRRRYRDRNLSFIHKIAFLANTIANYLDKFEFLLPEDVLDKESQENQAQEVSRQMIEELFPEIKQLMAYARGQLPGVKSVIQSNRIHNKALKTLWRCSEKIFQVYDIFDDNKELLVEEVLHVCLVTLTTVTRRLVNLTAKLGVPSVQLDAAVSNLIVTNKAFLTKRERHEAKVKNKEWNKWMQDFAKKWFAKKNQQLVDPVEKKKPQPKPKPKKRITDVIPEEDETQLEGEAIQGSEAALAETERGSVSVKPSQEKLASARPSQEKRPSARPSLEKRPSARPSLEKPASVKSSKMKLSSETIGEEKLEELEPAAEEPAPVEEPPTD